MVKKVGNLIPNTFFITKGSGESDLEKHAGSYHMALYDEELQQEVANQTWRNTLVLTTWLFMTPVSLISIS